MSTLDVAKLIEDSHRTARAHGWWIDCERQCDCGFDQTPGVLAHSETCPLGRNAGMLKLGGPSLDPAKVAALVPVKLLLTHSEIAEATEEYRLTDEKRGGKLGAVLYDCAGMPASEYHCQRDEAKAGDCPAFPWAKGTKSASIHKPVGFVVELADAAIRIADLVGALLIEPAVVAEYTGISETGEGIGDVVSALLALHELVVLAADYWWQEEYDAFARNLGGLIFGAKNLAGFVGGDLAAACEIKAAYNRTRSFRHGGKRA